MFLLNEDTPDGSTTENNETTETTTQEAEAVDPKELKNQVLRDLSKELGVNVFEAEGLQKVKSLIESQKTEQEKMQEKLQAYETERSQWETKEREYQAKLKATQLGVSETNLEDALKLADNDPSRLEEVVKKYPMFKSSKGVNIGVQDPSNNTPPSTNTEAEQYIEQYIKSNPKKAKYLRTKK